MAPHARTTSRAARDRVASGGAIDERDAGRAAFGVELDAANERVGAKREASGGERIGKDGVDGRGDCADLAALHAVAAVVARHALAGG